MIFNELVFADYLTDSKVTDFDSEISINKDVIKLDISMNYRPAVNMSESIDYLFEYLFSVPLLKTFPLFDELEQISSSCVFHDHVEMFRTFEYF